MREASLGRLRPLLPNEPCLHLPAAERALTERHLLPVLSELEVFFKKDTHFSVPTLVEWF